MKALDALIEKFLTDTKAVTPQPNPNYDPQAKAGPAPQRRPVKPGAAAGKRQQLEAESDAGVTGEK